jgi:hypothetical protein
VLHQNGRSIAYLGFVTGAPTPAPSTSQHPAVTIHPQPYPLHPPHNLARLFRLDMAALHDMWDTLEQGDVSDVEIGGQGVEGKNQGPRRH